MSVVKAPGLSLDLIGTIGSAVTFQRRRGRAVAMRPPVPTGPPSQQQQDSRAVWRWIMDAWKRAPVGITGAWFTQSVYRKLPARQLFAGSMMPALNGRTDILTAPWVPTVRTGIAPTGATVTPGAGTLSVFVPAPALPPGWAFSQSSVLLVPDQNPTGAFVGPFRVQTRFILPNPFNFSGLTAGQLYTATVWYRLSDPYGHDFHGPAYLTSGTPT